MEIQQAIQEIAGTRTIIVIAHRLSTVKRADKILVLKKGIIIKKVPMKNYYVKMGCIIN